MEDVNMVNEIVNIFYKNHHNVGNVDHVLERVKYTLLDNAYIEKPLDTKLPND